MARKEGMKPIHILVTKGQRDQINSFAERRGYKTTSDYIRELIQEDMTRAGTSIDLTVNRGGWRGGHREGAEG